MENLKKFIKDQYSKVVSPNTNRSSCCDSSCCVEEGFNEDYSNIEGYNPEADFGLGCGIPTQTAKIQIGQTVLDLGSGAGNDCFVARAEVGSEGHVIGIDFSEAMILKARSNAEKLNFENVEFILGDIEAIPFNSDSVDVVISNCVLNLVPDKSKAYNNIYRVLKPGGHFSISDVVTSVPLPLAMTMDQDLFSSCISGALSKMEYLEAIQEAGFKDVQVFKESVLKLPSSLYDKYDIPEGLKVLSITVHGLKG